MFNIFRKWKQITSRSRFIVLSFYTLILRIWLSVNQNKQSSQSFGNKFSLIQGIVSYALTYSNLDKFLFWQHTGN